MSKSKLSGEQTPADRLKLARRKAGFGTAQQATKHFKWPYATYIQHENGKRGIQRIAHEYAEAFEVTEAWLLLGEGDGPTSTYKIRPEAESDDGYSMVPEYDVQVSAGGGSLVEDEGIHTKWPFNPDYLSSELRVYTQNLMLVEVRGDSMEPTLSSGDRVMINRVDKQFSHPGIFVLWDGQGTVVKRIEYVFGSDPASIKLISDNPQHSTYEVPAESIEVIGRVIWVARRL